MSVVTALGQGKTETRNLDQASCVGAVAQLLQLSLAAPKVPISRTLERSKQQHQLLGIRCPCPTQLLLGQARCLSVFSMFLFLDFFRLNVAPFVLLLPLSIFFGPFLIITFASKRKS